MAKAETASTRLPRGTKPVAQAFLAALDAVPDASRAAVAKAAQTMIRDELKARREKQRATRSTPGRAAKAAGRTSGMAEAKPVRRRRSAASAPVES